jgi:putative hydrolase of the HAD superfamily
VTPLRAVIFDFGKVVCHFDIRIFLRAVAPCSELSQDALGSVLISSTDLAHQYESGRVTSDAFYQEVCRRAALRISREAFIAAYANIFTPIPSTFDLIRRLTPQYRLALLSNTNEWHFIHGIRPVEVFPLFDTVTLSYEVGAMKPDPRIYRDALEKLALPPSACVYIDDLPENVEAGRALGLHALHYTTHDVLLKDLRDLGIDPS